MSTFPPGVAADQPAYNILNNKTFTDSNVTSDANQTEIVTHAPHADVEWPPLVVYGVPVLCIVIFAVILLVIYLFPSPKHETKNCVQRCFESKEESQVSIHKIGYIMLIECLLCLG